MLKASRRGRLVGDVILGNQHDVSRTRNGSRIELPAITAFRTDVHELHVITHDARQLGKWPADVSTTHNHQNWLGQIRFDKHGHLPATEHPEGVLP